MSNQRLLIQKDKKLEHLEIQGKNYAQMVEQLNVERVNMYDKDCLHCTE